MGLRYGLLAALTLVLASALLWDRLHPSAPGRLADRSPPDPANLAVLVVGGAPPPGPPAGPASRPPGPAVAAAPAEAAPESWVVESGDTLSGIASSTLGSTRRAGDLARHNGLDLETPLRVGQVLRIPSAAPAPPAAPTAPPPSVARGAPASPAPPPAARPDRRTHTVARGENFYRIAVIHYGSGGRWREIARANGLDPEAPLPVGRELVIP